MLNENEYTEFMEERKLKLRSELNRIVPIIIKECNVDKIILFGSMARNSEQGDSDIDLCIVKDTNENYYDRVSYIGDKIECKVDMDLLVFNREEYNKSLTENKAFINEIINKGVVLYDSGAIMGEPSNN